MTKSMIDTINEAYGGALARIRELEAQLAETRANLAKADDDLNSAAYDLERQGRELAEARLDGARARWYFDRKNASKVVNIELRCIQADDWWDYQRWAQEIDAEMEAK